MTTLYYLVGIPGSGKTTFAKQIEKEEGAIRFSSDDIREELGITTNDNESNKRVFNVLHERLFKELNNGNSCIFDATNISWKTRRNFLNQLKKNVKTEINKVCYIVATPYELCLAYNKTRGRNVPEEVITRMYHNWYTPYYSEGWDSIFIYYGKEFYRGCNGDPEELVAHYYNWDQNNHHHQYGLGKHMALVADNVGKENINVYLGGLLHDIGKPLTRLMSYNNEAKYYQHHNVGAYEALFFDYNRYENADPIYISFLINHHMDVFFWNGKTETAINKFKVTFGEKEYEDVMTIHNADKTYH